MIFFLSFETQDFSSACDTVIKSIPCDQSPRLTVDQHKVKSLFRQVCTKKSTGPDGISAFVLKTFALFFFFWKYRKTLFPEVVAVKITLWRLLLRNSAWCPVFQQSLDTHTPSLPSGKKMCYYTSFQESLTIWEHRLQTSIVVKCLEKYLVSLLKTDINPLLDLFQFAYRNKKSTDDAVSSITHLFLSAWKTIRHMHVSFLLILASYLCNLTSCFKKRSS